MNMKPSMKRDNPHMEIPSVVGLLALGLISGPILAGDVVDGDICEGHSRIVSSEDGSARTAPMQRLEDSYRLYHSQRGSSVGTGALAAGSSMPPDRMELTVDGGKAEYGTTIFASATPEGAAVGAKFSTWSDVTAAFRPSRWGHPFAQGGTLSWLNYGAWRDAPGRTTKVIVGELLVVGATYAVIDGVSGGSSGGSQPQAEPSATATVGSTKATKSSSSTSVSGTTNPTPNPDPDPVPDSDDDENPFG